MEYTTADVFVYQILDCLVTQYDYKIVNVPRNKKDIWVANEKNTAYPMIRLSAEITSSAIFEQDYLAKIKGAIAMVINTQSPLLIINTNQESSSFVEGDVIQMVMNDEMISDTSLFTTFPALQGALRKVEDNQSECARLTRHLESNQMRKLKEARKFKWSTAPKVTCVIAAIALVIFFVIQFFVFQTDDSWLATLVASGGYYKALVVYQQEYWRILTTGWIHLDLITLIFYIVALYQVGKVCEKVYPAWKYALIFLGSLCIGNAFPLIFNDNVVSLGMGPGLFGVLAALVVYIREAKLYKNKLVRMQMNQIVMIALVSSLLNGIAFSAQVGGFLTGLFISVLVYKSETLQVYKKHFLICGMMMLVLLGYSMLQVSSAYPHLDELDKEIVKKYESLGLKEYAKAIDTTLNNVYEE